jgi:uncharacterized membrane protein
MTSYQILKALHVLGSTLFVGDMIVTFVWKMVADRSKRPETMAFAQGLVLVTDRWLLIPGIVLLVITGYVNAQLNHIPVWTQPALLSAQILFFISGALWIGLLVPLQKRQYQMASSFQTGDTIPVEYYAMTRKWITWGLVATVLPILSMMLMVIK